MFFELVANLQVVFFQVGLQLISLWWFDLSKLAGVTTVVWTANMFACRDVMAWKGFQPKPPADPMAYEKLMKRIRLLCQARGAKP